MKHWLSLFIITFLALIVFVLFFSVIKPPAEVSEDVTISQIPKLSEPTITFIDPVRGNPDAPITIVEFGDFQCPFCKTASYDLAKLISEYPNKVRLIWKDVPNERIHPMATASAVAARCAGEQGAFWEFHDQLFNQQEALSNQTISNIATEVNLDQESFENCVTDQTTLPRVQKSFEEAQSLGVPGTPFLYINNQPYNGKIEYAPLKQIIESL